ncbi:MAG: choice-of-anchor D domain-containing protein [Sedimentisphaerales bacterium]|nr:choice-of-anchor D domain-containing protein [Sedimentisphaerales bacterium]
MGKLSRLFRMSRPITRPIAKKSAVLRAEPLESRLLLADVFVWHGGADVVSPVDFGTVIEGDAPAVETFTLGPNTSSIMVANLDLTLPIGFSQGLDTLEDSLTWPDTDDFGIRLDTMTPGVKSGTVSIDGTLPIFSSLPMETYSFTVTGTVLALPEISASHNAVDVYDNNHPLGPSVVDFAPTKVGTTAATETFTVYNTGDLDLTLGTIQVPTGFELVSPLPGSIAGGDSATFQVRLDTSVPGDYSGDIWFNNNDAGPVHGDGVDETNFRFQVNGTVTEPEIVVEVGAVDVADGQAAPVSFGTVEQNDPPVFVTFTVSNEGNAVLELGALDVTGAAFSLSSNNLPTSLAPTESATFTVQMDTGDLGDLTGMVNLVNDDLDENPFDFPIAGNTVAPEIDVELVLMGGSDPIADGQATAIDFGVVGLGGSPTYRVFEVTNVGTSTLNLGSVNLPAGYTLTEGLDAALTPGSSDTFQVRLDTAAVGTKAGQISFSNNDNNENPFNFPISGTVNAPDIAVSINGTNIVDGQGGVIDFGEVIPGEVGESLTFTVQNVGDATLSLGSVQLPAGFTVIEALAGTLGPGESDTFTVRLDSDVPGIKDGEISFVNNDPNENPFNFPVGGEVYHLIESTQYNSVVEMLGYEDQVNTGVSAYLIGPGTLFGYAATGSDMPLGYVTEDTEMTSYLFVLTEGAQPTNVEEIIVRGDLLMAYGFSTTVQDNLASTGAVGYMFLDGVGAGATFSTQAPMSGFGSMFWGRTGVGDGADFDIAGDMFYFRTPHFAQGNLSANSVGYVIVDNGDTGMNVTAENGGINLMYALNGDVTGSLLASENVGSVYSPAGTISGTIRGANIGNVFAQNLNGALLSAKHDISSVNVTYDVLDSHVMAGYDIGMDGLPGGGDTINQGDLGAFSFGGAYGNSHVAVGVRPIFSTLIPAPSGGNNSSDQQSSGAVTGLAGSSIATDNGGQLFGFYFDANSASTFNTSLNSSGDFQIVSNVNG